MTAGLGLYVNFSISCLNPYMTGLFSVNGIVERFEASDYHSADQVSLLLEAIAYRCSVSSKI